MRMLPIVKYEGKQWFFDERLRELRNITNPFDVHDLNTFTVDYFKDVIAKRSSRRRTRDTNSQGEEGNSWKGH